MTRKPRDPLAGLAVVHRPRWFVWRDIVTMLLAIAVVLLVRQVGDLKDQLSAASATRTAQIEKLTNQLVDLQRALGQSQQALITAQRQSGAKDARIRQLTDALVTADVPVPPVKATAGSFPSPVPAPSPSGVRSTPEPAPTVTVTITATPHPTPTRTCFVIQIPLLPLCFG